MYLHLPDTLRQTDNLKVSRRPTVAITTSRELPITSPLPTTAGPPGFLVVLVFAMVVRGPRTDRCTDDDRVDVGRHRMFHIGWYKQEAADGISCHVIQI